MWSRHIRDPILASNLTRRVDFAMFMLAALENDSLIHEAPAIVECRPPRRSHTSPQLGRVMITDALETTRRCKTNRNTMTSNRRAAAVAGWLYVLGFVTGILSVAYAVV